MVVVVIAFFIATKSKKEADHSLFRCSKTKIEEGDNNLMSSLYSLQQNRKTRRRWQLATVALFATIKPKTRR